MSAMQLKVVLGMWTTYTEHNIKSQTMSAHHKKIISECMYIQRNLGNKVDVIGELTKFRNVE